MLQPAASAKAMSASTNARRRCRPRGGRVSYNGPGGVRVRPRPTEIQAIREPHTPPMSTQMQHVQQAQQIRQNFARVNHGRPQVVVDQKPIQADRNVRPPAPVPSREGTGSQRELRNGQTRPSEQGQRTVQPSPRGEPVRPGTRETQPRVNQGPNQPEPNRAPRANPAKPVAPMRPQPAPREQQPAPTRERPFQQPHEGHPAPDRQAPEHHAQPAPERQSPRVERPMPQQRPAPEQRRQAVPQQRPAPQQNHPQPPQSHAPEHRQGPPANKPGEEKRPH